MIDTNTLLIGGAVLVFILVLFVIPWGGKCNCSKNYTAPRSAQFTVNRPKYNVTPTYPEQRRENYIVPTPTKAQTIKSDNTNGGFVGPTSMPYMGGISGEITYGTSVPGKNTATTLSGNGAGNSEAMATWKTVI